MIDPTVRPAVAADVAELRLLEAESRSALAGERGAARWLATHPPVGDGWQAVVDAGDVFVAHIDSVPVGYLRLAVVDDVAEVCDVFVREGARELGFGDELLAAALTLARRRGASLLEGSALPGDRNVKNLYERAGIKARLITVSVDLGG